MQSIWWHKSWFAGLVVSVAILLLDFAGVWRGFERMSYDAGVALAHQDPGSDVIIVAIDERSLANIGRWPWPRQKHAALLQKLAGATVIGNTVLFLEPQQDQALSVLRDLAEQLANEKRPDSTTDSKLMANLRQAMTELDGDTQLINEVKTSAKVIVGLPFVFGEPHGRPLQPLPDFVRRFVIKPGDDDKTTDGVIPVRSMVVPWPEFSEAVAGIGHQVANVETDGIVRQEPLVVDYYDDLIPSMALLIAARYLGIDTSEISVGSSSIFMGELEVKTDQHARMNTFYYQREGSKPAFEVDSVFDVLSDNIQPDKYDNKIVLIGPTAHGLTTLENIPGSDGARSAPVVRLAHTVTSIVNQHGFTSPGWNPALKMAAFLVVALFLMFGLPRLNAGIGALVSLSGFVGLLGVQILTMSAGGVWLKLVLALVTLALGYVVLTTQRYFLAERGKVRADRESTENLRSIGLNFQEKGQLDQAFDAFTRSGGGHDTLSAIYNLALDFESKRQFNKARTAYEYICSIDTKFRDVEARRDKALKLETSVLLSPGGGDATIVFDEAGEVAQPTLGRYVIEKEIGKGAMGVVYLGRDPKINRRVAIKTLDLGKSFDEDEISDVKARFFREAQAAGRLRHPNIVTIYDAGEERDLAYIAMEVLTGRNLIHYGKPENLLPTPVVMDIIGACVDALHYAHSQNVVHRDIKPGNIMYEPQTNIVKITDFGIARITDASRTKTGTVMGTPSYMSPEQLAGQKVDGRSDLFSLGVTMYLLLTGRWPFKAESLTNLMYKIANEPHPPLHSLVPRLANVDCISERIIDRALQKDVEKRFQTGAEFREAIESCRIENLKTKPESMVT